MHSTLMCLMQERAREQEKVQQNQPPHPSQAVVQQAVHSKTANRHLNAMEMIEWAANRHKRELVRQQQLEQQQAQALEQQRAQAQQAALAGGSPTQQPPNAPLPAVSTPAPADLPPLALQWNPALAGIKKTGTCRTCVRAL